MKVCLGRARPRSLSFPPMHRLLREIECEDRNQLRYIWAGLQPGSGSMHLPLYVQVRPIRDVVLRFLEDAVTPVETNSIGHPSIWYNVLHAYRLNKLLSSEADVRH